MAGGWAGVAAASDFVSAGRIGRLGVTACATAGAVAILVAPGGAAAGAGAAWAKATAASGRGATDDVAGPATEGLVSAAAANCLTGADGTSAGLAARTGRDMAGKVGERITGVSAG